MHAEPRFLRMRAAWGELQYWRHRLFRARRYRQPHIEHTATMSLLMLPEVFNGVLLESGRIFADALDSRLIPPGAHVLDVGTGSGIAAIRAAQLGAYVTALDINLHAVRCARINAALNHVEDCVRVFEGDLFEPVRGECFDRILFNPPFYCRRPASNLDAAWCSEDAFDRFLSGLDGFLRPDGFCLLLLSNRGDLSHSLKAAGLRRRISVAARKDVIHEVFTLYRLERETQADVAEVRCEA